MLKPIGSTDGFGSGLRPYGTDPTGTRLQGAREGFKGAGLRMHRERLDDAVRPVPDATGDAEERRPPADERPESDALHPSLDFDPQRGHPERVHRSRAPRAAPHVRSRAERPRAPVGDGRPLGRRAEGLAGRRRAWRSA